MTHVQTPAASNQTQPKSPPRMPRGSWRESIEGGVWILVFVCLFRTFVAEAFVIPTGSMAPTLLGAHMRFTCPDCGYRFDVNFGVNSREASPTIASRGLTPGNIFCPNCGFRVQRAGEPAPVGLGDRIFVTKYWYLLHKPQRWDVVVFKAPHSPVPNDDYSTNYIKRLVGLPGESVMILDGDIYVSGKPDAQLEDFQVQAKPRAAQEAMWRIVYDNDFYPQRQGWAWPWKPLAAQSGWDTEKAGGRVFAFDKPSGSGTLFFDSAANGGTPPMEDWRTPGAGDDRGMPLSDWLAYDIVGAVRQPNNFVGDIKLELVYHRSQGQGPLTLRLAKRSDLFEVLVTAEGIELRHNGQPAAEPYRHKGIGTTPAHIEFANVDYRVSLRLDGELVQEMRYQPDVRRLVEEAASGTIAPQPLIQMTAEGQECTLSHVRLWRDVYYLNLMPGAHGREPVRGGAADFPRHIVHLGKDEYFMLGDNSLISGDARLWSQGVDLPLEELYAAPGIVPGRFLLGRALCVVWPTGYKVLGQDFIPALVPDFGRMRFIH